MDNCSPAGSAADRIKTALAGRVTDADLMKLDAIGAYVVATGPPSRQVGAFVLDALRDDGTCLFILHAGDSPHEVMLDDPPPSRPAPQGRRVLSPGIGAAGRPLPSPSVAAAAPLSKGPAGVLELLSLLGGDAAAMHVAILRSDAQRLFGCGGTVLTLISSTEAADTKASQADATVVQPVDARWPLAPRAEWTDAMRDEVFRMRHQHGKTDKAIATVVGRSHSVVSQQIGAKETWKLKDDAWPKNIKWRPPPSIETSEAAAHRVAVLH